MSKIEPCLWFVGEAEQAANFYVSLLPDSRIEYVQQNIVDNPGGKAGTVLLVEFTLAGQRFLALNGGMEIPYTNAVSFKIDCADRSRSVVGCVVGGRQGAAMRLAAGSLRRHLADRAERVAQIDRRSGPRRRATRDASDDGDGEARYCRHAAGL
jgi:hypothetical protein